MNGFLNIGGGLGGLGMLGVGMGGLGLARSTTSYKDWDLYVNFRQALADKVQKEALPPANYDTPHYNLVSGQLQTFGVDEYVRDDEGRVLTCGGYTVLNGKSNDISDPYWYTDAGVVIYGSNGFQASAQYDDLLKSISTTDSALYTLSADIWVEEGGQLDNYGLRHIDSADGNVTYISLSHERKRYTTTVLGKTGGGVVQFGFFDANVSNWSKVYIENINITESPYQLPFVPNDTTGTISVSATYADDNAGDAYGPRLPFASLPQAFAALSDAGEIEWRGRFGFGWEQQALSAQVLIGVNVSDFSGLKCTTVGRIYGDDGPTNALADADWIANTDYTATLKYGPHPGYANALKMQLSITDGVTTWESSVVDFDGSFDPADFLFFGYKNIYPVWHESLKFRKEVTW